MILGSKHVGAILNILILKNIYVSSLVGVLISWFYYKNIIRIGRW